MKRTKTLLLILALLLVASTARAACTSPAAVAGAIIYNSNYSVMQFCNGTTWMNMGATGSGVLPTCAEGETVSMNSGVWACIAASTDPSVCTAPCTDITISVSTNNVNLFTLAGSPVTAGNYRFTINSGVTIGSTSSSSAALDTGTFPSGSKIWLINNGTISGAGGAGGAGGTYNGSATFVFGATAGGDGGSALALHYPLIVTNGSGFIKGGGGGGAGG